MIESDWFTSCLPGTHSIFLERHRLHGGPPKHCRTVSRITVSSVRYDASPFDDYICMPRMDKDSGFWQPSPERRLDLLFVGDYAETS